jgi:RNA-directed DNA polymerase
MQTTRTVTGTERPTDWHTVDWRRANRNVRNLRHRIFRATEREDWKTVRSLQRLMLRSYANTLVSVRRVTQVNHGKKTAGIDKKVALNPTDRAQLVDRLMEYQPWRAKPAKRVSIPKANGKLRPLGIPVMTDRALQVRVKNALEPVWEARFEGSSCGFRPGRSTHDAIAKTRAFVRPNNRKRWVVDADITGAFDHIDHDFLLNAIGEVPGRELIRQWLKAGYVDAGVFHETEEGTPQGGVISALLANIALHGLEQALGVRHDNRGRVISARGVVRYADDFVVFCESREDAETAIDLLKAWLAVRGLQLSEEKTRIVHLTDGFDFLGFNVRLYPSKGTNTGYKLRIKPSKDAQKRIRAKLRAEWRRLHGANIQSVIRSLNPIIRGWAGYYRHVAASQTFTSLANWMYHREKRWMQRRHPKKSRTWQHARYFGRLNPRRQDRWVFGDTQTGMYLSKFNWADYQRYTPVPGKHSPDNPALRDYWERKNAAKTKESLPAKKARQARIQNHRCPVCGESIHNGEEIHAHHIYGRNNSDKVILLHRYCHQQVTASKGKRALQWEQRFGQA